MPSYQQNKKYIQKWVENNPEKEREKVLRGMKTYYNKNREKIAVCCTYFVQACILFIGMAFIMA
jgi:hypothetical protein